MRKFITLLSFLIFLWSMSVLTQIVPTSYYKFKCMQSDVSACSKYLFIESWENAKKESYTTNINKQSWGYWKNRYLSKIETQEDAYLAISTMLASLDDPYTRFLTPDELEDQNMNINAELSGIGVVISSLDGKIKVEDVIENSPAARNGLKIGDIIIKVNKVSVSGLDIKKVADMIRGKSGTVVRLVIIRDNKTIRKTITRANIKIKAVSSKEISKEIGYIRISTFMSIDAAKEFMEALKKVKSDKIILDLRGNQGGLLQNATFISNMLLTDGIIVSVIGKGNHKEVTKVQPSDIREKRQMVILTNGLTASSSEILAAALQENKRAVIVGEKTYGKGLIQRIIPLPFNTAMNVTIAKYLTPLGHDINKNGIKPNYEVKLTMKDLEKGKDTQLNKAIDILKNNTVK